jgi:hypothetical protein
VHSSFLHQYGDSAHNGRRRAGGGAAEEKCSWPDRIASREHNANQGEVEGEGAHPAKARINGERIADNFQPFELLAFLDEYEFIWAPLIFTALAFFTRMYKIGLSPIVTWDEAQ